MNRRQIELHCESNDGTKVFASLDDWSADGGVPETHVILRTTGGRPVCVRMADGRELAGWLIEHCAEDPDAITTDPWASPPMGNICTIPECSGYGTTHH